MNETIRRKISYRLGYIMQQKKFDGKTLSKNSNVSESSISNYLNNHAEPTRRTLQKLAKALDVDMEWLSGYSPFDKIYTDTTNNLETIINIYNKLNENHKRHLLETAILLKTAENIN